jgi:hypothetical protein
MAERLTKYLDKYSGANPFIHLKAKTKSLNKIFSEIFNHLSDLRPSEI